MDSLTEGKSTGREAGSCIIRLIKGDITRLETRLEPSAIVNAANTSLSGGGGVDGAIHRAGGPAIMDECDLIRTERGGIATGDAVVTTAGKLPVAHIIHTAGPIWHGGHNGEERLLAKCYQNCLKLAVQLELKSLAFPNISTGVYGFPKSRAAAIAVKTVVNFLKKQPAGLEEVYFVCFDEENYQYYQKLMPDELHVKRDVAREIPPESN